tara:strand:- start:123 stop:341 length:219 start_codon:yes stop_codon:yes gene_type:complete
MAYSFASLWTVVLVIALVATIIHQVRFQDSPTHINLNLEVRSLEFQNQGLHDSLDQSEMKYDNYRQWVMSWR